MCRTYRYIDPDPSFVFIGPPPSTRPVAAGRRLARPPLPAIRDLDRAPPPPPQALGRHPPPSAWPAPPAPGRPPPLATGRRSAGPAGAVGGARTPPSWHQLGEKRKCWLWGPKNKPPKIDESSIFAPKGAPFIFGQVLKKSRRSNEYFERYSQKTWGEGRICPPFPVRVLIPSASQWSLRTCHIPFLLNTSDFCLLNNTYGPTWIKLSHGSAVHQWTQLVHNWRQFHIFQQTTNRRLTAVSQQNIHWQEWTFNAPLLAGGYVPNQ